jgi:predicted Zn finger-like uncharacterized protein
MTLVTTCPHCSTRFKVVPDQLKLRQGLVRCGVCQQVFSGSQHLDPVPGEALDPGEGPASGEGPTTQVGTDPDPPPAASATVETPEPEPAYEFDPALEPEPEPALPGLAASPPESALIAPATVYPVVAIPLRRSNGRTGRDEADPFAAIGEPPARRRASKAAWMVALLLALALLGQALFAWRDTLAARVPATAPALAALLRPVGLALEPPRTLSAVTIESFELQASGTPGRLVMSALIRNAANHAVRWPSMELTLTDPAGAVLVRKVLEPETFLEPGESARGLAPRSEHSVRLVFSNAGPPPTGYAVSLFHP